MAMVLVMVMPVTWTDTALNRDYLFSNKFVKKNNICSNLIHNT